MDTKLKQLLIDKIITSIPPTMKPVEYLTDALELGKDSVYRRLKGHIDFTFSELILLASMLDFSLDKIFSEYNEKIAAFKLSDSIFEYPEGQAIEMFGTVCNNLKNIYNSGFSESVIVTNHLLWIFATNYEHLFKFFYYRWVQQFEVIPINYYYKDINVPERLKDMAKETMIYENRLNQSVIIDNDINHGILREIKYFREVGLIAKDDILKIKKDLTKLTKDFHTILQTGINEYGSKWNVYLSTVRLDSSSAHLRYDDKCSSFFWIHYDNFIHSSDSLLCRLQLDWIESLKKTSVLISRSNQKMQIDFIKNQLELFESL